MVEAFELSEDQRERIRAAAKDYLRAELPRLDAAGLLPSSEHESPWINWERLLRFQRGDRETNPLARALREIVPDRWPEHGRYRPVELAEAFVRGVVAAATVEQFRHGSAESGPGAQIAELIDLVEHPKQPVRAIRLLSDLDSTAVEGASIHDLRLRNVRGLLETLGLEVPEAASEVLNAHVMPGSREPRTLLIADREGLDPWHTAFDARPHFLHAASALRLITAGSILEVVEVFGQPKVVHVGGPEARILEGEHGTYWRRVASVDPSQLAALNAIASQVCALLTPAEGKVPPALAAAISRFNRSHVAAPWGDLVLDIAIALEAALSTGKEEEITLRVRSRAAHLLARPADPPATIFRDVGELLALRGTIAHGDIVPPKSWERLFKARGLEQVFVEDRRAVWFDRWRDLARRAILARLLLASGGGPDWPLSRQPPRSIDEVLVDPAGRLRMRRAIRRRAAELDVAKSIDPPPPLRDVLHEPWGEGYAH